MFSDNLKSVREKSGISQAALAKVLNVSQGTIGNWETGKRVPDIDMLKQISHYFGISVDYLIDNTDYPYIVTATEMEELKNPNVISKNIAAFGGAETLTVDSDALDAAIERALKAKGLI